MGRRIGVVVLIAACSLFGFSFAADLFSVVERPWFAARTPHFQTFSCGLTQEVARLTARLEQFRMAYETLAGTQSVASPLINVIAFPDHDWLERFVPLYQGQPINHPGFFIAAAMRT